MKLKTAIEYWEKYNSVLGYPRYIIGDEGTLIKLPSMDFKGNERYGRIIKPQIDSNGYVKVVLTQYGKQKNMFLHRLVCAAFNPNPHCKLQVNHKNGIKTDCRAINLEWSTDKENKEHAVKMNLNAKGSNNGKSKLNEENVADIKRLLDDGILTQKLIAVRFNIHPSVISDIKNKRIWKHVH